MEGIAREIERITEVKNTKGIKGIAKGTQGIATKGIKGISQGMKGIIKGVQRIGNGNSRDYKGS